VERDIYIFAESKNFENFEIIFCFWTLQACCRAPSISV
jgi:hypothetical protein